MATYFMLGRYSTDAMKSMSTERTKDAEKLINKLGGIVNSMYALLGEYDLVLIVDFPGIDNALKTSVELNKMTGIAFRTCPAVTVKTFDELIARK